MDSFELNKIIGAVLGTLLFVMGIGFLAEAVYTRGEDDRPGLALPEAASTEHGTEVAEVVIPLGNLMATASMEDGTSGTNKCKACHTFEEGGSTKQGPNLWGVVGRPIASMPGFNYSASLAAHGAAGEIWSYENLNTFLTRPKGFAADTKMTFGGEPDPQIRADMLMFLSTLAATPMPFPPVEEVAAEGVDVVSTDTPAEPAAETVVETPDTTASETPVEGTSTTAPATDAAPETPAADAMTEAPAAETTTETPVQ